MNYELVPVSHEKVLIAEEELKKLKVVSSPEQFIGLFNSGIISATNPLVKSTALAITEAYENLKQLHNKIIIKSEYEVAFDVSIEILKGWKLVSTLKRVANQMLEEGFSPDTDLLFYEKKPGMLHYKGVIESLEDIENNTNSIHQYNQKEKLFGGNSSLINNIFLGSRVFLYNEEEEIIGIKIQDIIEADESFIIKIKEDLLNSLRFN